MTLTDLRKHWLETLGEKLLCVDVGARWGADSALMALKDHAKILCFDPDEEECARLQADHPTDKVEYVPLALSSDGRALTLHSTREPACSSIFPPIQSLYETYPALACITPERTIDVRSTTLDAYLALHGNGTLDALKLDTQGSELDILLGCTDHIATASMIDIEVEFNPLYSGQALFSDVDQFLRKQGFGLWRLPLLAHYAPESFNAASTPLLTNSAPPSRTESTSPGNGQLFWAQAHYVRRDLLRTDPRPIDRTAALKGAAIAGAYGYWDLSLMALDKCTDTRPEAIALRQLLQAV